MSYPAADGSVLPGRDLFSWLFLKLGLFGLILEGIVYFLFYNHTPPISLGNLVGWLSQLSYRKDGLDPGKMEGGGYFGRKFFCLWIFISCSYVALCVCCHRYLGLVVGRVGRTKDVDSRCVYFSLPLSQDCLVHQILGVVVFNMMSSVDVDGVVCPDGV